MTTCASLLIVGAGCDTDKAAVEDPSRLVVTEAVAVEDAVDRLVLLGEIQGEVEIRVFSQVPERIQILHVREGATVAAGDPIATLDGQLASSDLAQAGAAVSAAAAARDRLVRDLERVGGLVAQGAAAVSQREQLESQLRAADAQLAQVIAARSAAGERRSRTVVRAPADGIVSALVVSEGDVAAPQIPLCTIVQMDRVKVVTHPVEADYVQIRPEMPVEVVPPSLPDVRRTGRIQSISPVLDRLTRTATVEIEVDNPEHVLRPGMVAEVRIELARREAMTMVPARAVIMTTQTDSEHTATVFVRAGDRAERRSVTIGPRYGDRIAVEEGLAVGEEVVVEGQHLLRDGSRIRVRGEPARAEVR